jgi:hypothetical protein
MFFAFMRTRYPRPQVAKTTSRSAASFVAGKQTVADRDADATGSPWPVSLGSRDTVASRPRDDGAAMTARLMIFSFDGHVGGPPDSYLEYIEPRYRNDLEALRAENDEWAGSTILVGHATTLTIRSRIGAQPTERERARDDELVTHDHRPVLGRGRRQ